jgi:N utilization substance protein B
MKRSEAREKAFQFLFQLDINEDIEQKAIEEYIEEQENDAFLRQLIEGVFKEQADLDHTISESLENWTLNRLPSVERTVLRLAVYEINYLDDIPPKVSINEAVELGNKYGEENKSGKFINGVLSKIIQKKGNEA